MPTMQDFEKGKECVQHSLEEKEAAKAFFQGKADEPVGVPSDGKNCPIFHFLSAACPEISIISFSGSVEVCPIDGTKVTDLYGTEWVLAWHPGMDGKKARAAQYMETLPGSYWAEDFVSRVDGPWARVFGGSKPIPGAVALGILERSGTYASEADAFREWLKVNDPQEYASWYDEDGV